MPIVRPLQRLRESRGWQLALAALVYLALVTAIRPLTVWEFDEALFIQGVEHYDPLAHHPPPPGCPLFIRAGQLVNVFVGDPFVALMLLNIVASVLGFVFFALAFGRLSGSATAGLVGSAIFYLSPALLIHAPTPITDPGALCLLGAALLYGVHSMERDDLRDAVIFAALASASVGWRPQFAIAIVPLFLVNTLLMRSWRNRIASVVTFGAVSVAWMSITIAAVGGVTRFLKFQHDQARYLGAHDADVSRSGWTPARLAFRFIGRAFGPELLAFSVLIIAAIGAIVLLRTRNMKLLPYAVAAAVYIGFALAVMDPADGVRYALPFTTFLAFAAGAGLEWIAHRTTRYVSLGALVAVYAIASLSFTASILGQRRATPAPPVQAAAYASSAFPKGSVALYELPLWPHSQLLMRKFEIQRVNDGLERYFHRPDVPLFIYADGASSIPGARVFKWEFSDAYNKLTRNHFRVVSIIPVPPERRFRTVRGLHPPEREPEGDEWRWSDGDTTLELPPMNASAVAVTLALPKVYPFETNVATLAIGDRQARVELRRGERTRVVLPLGRDRMLRMLGARTFVPADLPGSLNRDPRRLSFHLFDLEMLHEPPQVIP